MKKLKLTAVFIIAAFVFSLCSCTHYPPPNYGIEENLYSEAITELFTALDGGDAGAVYNMFSPEAREKDEDLYADIGKLLEVYKGPCDEIGFDGLLSTQEHIQYGKKKSLARTVFPVRCGEVYYWCHLGLVYRNTIDDGDTGIAYAEFLTADEYFILINSGGKLEEAPGLTVRAEKTAECEIRAICGEPLEYTRTERTIDIEEVKLFLNKNTKTEDFRERFGEPNAEHIYLYYELPSEDGKLRYLRIGSGRISYACITDDFAEVEAVWKAPKPLI